MNTIQYSPQAFRYMQQVFPWAHPRPWRKRHLDHFSHFCMAHYVTDRLTDHATRSVTIGGAHSGDAKFSYCLRMQQKQSSQIHHACLSFVSVHQMAPPLTEVGDNQTTNCSLLLIYRLQRDERLSWPGWLTCSGWFTHISGHPSATGLMQDGKFAGQRLTFYRCATANCNVV